MSLFTIDQYDEAIKSLQAAKQQHIDKTTGEGCSVCGGSCHPDNCGFNPLYAMHLCEETAKNSLDLHESLHILAGFHTRMGERIGVARIVKPSSGE